MPARSPDQTAPKVLHSPMEHPRHQYPRETAALQEIARSCGLTETTKWGKPCYTRQASNIVLIQRFNNYIALMFFQGALLRDPEKLLARVGKMQAPRHLRFTSLAEITQLEPTIKAYIHEAIELDRSGAKVQPKPASACHVPDELQTRLDADPNLRQAFAALTPGRQKGYLFQIAAARQSATRAARVEKFIPRILAGKGLND